MHMLTVYNEHETIDNTTLRHGWSDMCLEKRI